jgi:hypothetical protein
VTNRLLPVEGIRLPYSCPLISELSQPAWAVVLSTQIVRHKKMSFLFGRSEAAQNTQQSAPMEFYSPSRDVTVSPVFGGLEFDKKTMKPRVAADADLEYIYLDDQHPPGVPLPPGVPAMPERPSGSWGPLPMRTDSDKMLYGTGAAYILGQALGGSYGLIRGWNNPQATTLKLKINSVLNTCTRTGPWMANHGGALGKPLHCF